MSSGLAGAAATAAVLSLGTDTQENSLATEHALPPEDLPEAHRKKKPKVVFVGAHTDDWIVCGGTIARYTRLGHEALFISFTAGNSVSMADVNHVPMQKLAALRRAQAIRGSEILGARIMFLNQTDLRMHVDPGSYQESCLQRMVAKRYEVCLLFLRNSRRYGDAAATIPA